MPSTIRKRLAGLRRDPDDADSADPRYQPDDFSAAPRPVVAICHPDWFGIRATTHGYGVPVVEAPDLSRAAARIIPVLTDAGTRLVVVNGFPPGTAEFATAAAAAGIVVRVLMHSSMTQHGFEPNEAQVITELYALRSAGAVDAIGFTKEHVLHRYTHRLWSWRDSFGDESYWAVRLGEEIAAAGADALWPTITAA